MWAVKYGHTGKFFASKMSMEPTDDPEYICLWRTNSPPIVFSDSKTRSEMVLFEYDSEGLPREVV
jgi:hypothetical protein